MNTPTHSPTLKELIHVYARACCRDGNPSWQSDEGKAMLAAINAIAEPVLSNEVVINYREGVNTDRLVEALQFLGIAGCGQEEMAVHMSNYINRLTRGVMQHKELWQIPVETNQLLRKFLDAAGGEGLVLGDVDAGDLYISMYGYEPPDALAAQRITLAAILPTDEQITIAAMNRGIGSYQTLAAAFKAGVLFGFGSANQATQPVESSSDVREWIEEALSYVGCESWSPSLYRDGVKLLDELNLPIVEVAAPVAPIEPTEIERLAKVAIRECPWKPNQHPNDWSDAALQVCRVVVSRAALSAPQPELSDAQIMNLYDAEIALGGSADSVIVRMVRKLQAGGAA